MEKSPNKRSYKINWNQINFSRNSSYGELTHEVEEDFILKEINKECINEIKEDFIRALNYKPPYYDRINETIITSIFLDKEFTYSIINYPHTITLENPFL